MFREIDTAQGIAVIGAMTLFFIAGVGMLSKPVPLPQITVSVRSQSAQVSSALDNGLIGWWKLDEGSGTTASDSSQNGNTGTLMPSSNLPVWTNGLVGQALSFNGVINGNSANMVMLPIAFGNRLSSTTGTVSAWVKMNNWNDGKNDPMVLLYKAGTDYIELFHNGSNKILGQLVVAGNAYAPSYSIPSGFSGWHHLAFTWNAAAGNVILFVDGQIANTATGFPGFYKFPNANCFGVLYCNPTDVAAAFNGSLDDVRIYNRALSASEIQQIFTLDSGNQTGSSGTSTTTTSSSPDTNATATSTQLAVPTGSTTYYIDYAVGNDANIGTSPSSPWQHSPGDPNAVGNPKLATLKPGDTVAFKGGVVYQFPSTGGYIGAMASGSSGSPITYISGNLLPVPWPDANSQAVIDGTNSTLNGRGTNNGIITLGSYSWLVVDGFEIRNSHPFVDATQMAYTAGISWGGQSAGSGNITIKNNYIHDLAMDGVYIYGKWDAAPANQVPSNFNIVGNRIMRTNGHGLLQSRGFNNVVIENNYFDLNGTDFNHTGQTDIQADNIFLTAYNTTAGNTQYNTIIRNNIFKKSDVSLGYAPTKSHILISNQENANIYGNIFTGQPAVASIDAGWPIHGLNIFNNVFTANIFTFTGLIDFHAISATTIFSGVNIINNTFVGSPAHGGVIDVTSGNANNMTILNNIIDGNPDSGNFAKFGYQTDVFFGTGLLDYASLQINNN